MNLRGIYTPLRPENMIRDFKIAIIRVNQEFIHHFLMDNGELIIDNWLMSVERIRSFFSGWSVVGCLLIGQVSIKFECENVLLLLMKRSLTYCTKPKW